MNKGHARLGGRQINVEAMAWQERYKGRPGRAVGNRHDRQRAERRIREVIAVANDALEEDRRSDAFKILVQILTLQDAFSLVDYGYPMPWAPVLGGVGGVGGSVIKTITLGGQTVPVMICEDMPNDTMVMMSSAAGGMFQPGMEVRVTNLASTYKHPR